MAPDAAAPRPFAETIASLPEITFLENLAVADDGALLITSYLDGKILRIEPSGRMSDAAVLSGAPVGLAHDTDGTV